MYMIIFILNLSQVKPIQPLILWINLWKIKNKKKRLYRKIHILSKKSCQ
jgi:hypothetical protein